MRSAGTSAQHELRPACLHILLQPLADEVGRAERGAGVESRGVDAPRGMKGSANDRATAGSGSMQYCTSVRSDRQATSRPLGREAERLVDADAELLGRDERRIQPSPMRPARRIAASLLPPTHNGIGCWIGRGSTVMRRASRTRPRRSPRTPPSIAA